MLAASLIRSGFQAASGTMSSMAWMPVTRGLYSASTMATSTPSSASSASNRAGTTVPSAS